MTTLGFAGAPGLAFILAAAAVAAVAVSRIARRARAEQRGFVDRATDGAAADELDRQRDAATRAWAEWAEAEREAATCR